MKKLVLTGSFLLALVAGVYAQNSATVVQKGDRQISEQKQEGDKQISVVTQTMGAGVNRGNFAGTYQTGAGINTATVNQKDGSQGNRAGITQKIGSNNEATINQNAGVLGISGGTTVLQSAGNSSAAGDGNISGIAQEGFGNKGVANNQNNNSKGNASEIWQNGDNNINTTTSQSNNSLNNFVEVLQGWSSKGMKTTASYDSKATVEQNGDEAYASSFNQAWVKQTGTSQTATILQNASYYASSDHNEAMIKQSGSNQTATINQNGESRWQSYSGSSYNQASINQQDYDNVANINQSEYSLSNRAVINQQGSISGMGNTASIGQVSSSSFNQAEITQGTATEGATNSTATIYQGWSLNGHHEAYLQQTGDSQTAGVTQKGTYNKLFGSADGLNDPTNPALQSGDNNSLTVLQESYARDGGNVAYAIQAGSGNTATIVQTSQPYSF